jgi:hypothetical protein
MTRLAIVLSLCAAAAGCATPFEATSLNVTPEEGAMKPHANGAVALIASGSPIKPHVDVALFRTASGGPVESQLTELREHGAAKGCDAVVILGGEGHSLLGTCIVYTPAPAPAAP